MTGLGADELCGGYGRHRTAYERGGYESVKDVLALEVARLWERNLMRDDRCVGGNGVELRFPFLDERVVQCVQNMDITDVVDFERPQGEGDKMVLRKLAEELGGKEGAGRIKRAMQFGTRIVKGEKGRKTPEEGLNGVAEGEE